MQKKVAIQLGVIGASIVVLVILSIPLIRGKSEPSRSPGVNPVAVSSPKPESRKPDSSVPVIKLGQVKDDKFYRRFSRAAEVLPLDRDPFTFAYTGPKSSRDGLELTGILWDETKPTAVINQTFLGAGDSTNEFTVVKVLQDRVVLKDANGEFELRLKS